MTLSISIVLLEFKPVQPFPTRHLHHPQIIVTCEDGFGWDFSNPIPTPEKSRRQKQIRLENPGIYFLRKTIYR